LILHFLKFVIFTIFEICNVFTFFEILIFLIFKNFYFFEIFEIPFTTQCNTLVPRPRPTRADDSSAQAAKDDTLQTDHRPEPLLRHPNLTHPHQSQDCAPSRPSALPPKQVSTRIKAR
jgi:hypothetical protein